MNGIGWEVISITGAQAVGFVTNAQFQSAADDPVRLVLGVRMWAILRAGRVARLKDAVTFFDQASLQFMGFWRAGFSPALNFNIHVFTLPQASRIAQPQSIT